MANRMAPFFETVLAGAVIQLRGQIDKDPSVVHSTIKNQEHPEFPAGTTGLHVAVAANNVKGAEVLLEAGADLEARNSCGRTPLHDSIEYGRSELQRLFLEHGANVDICSAAILGQLERLKELLSHQPKLVEDQSTGLTPLGWAAFGNQVETAAVLLANGARPEAGELLCAASVGHVAVGRLLIEYGADPNELSDESGGNALHEAACMRYTIDSVPFVSMLLEYGVDRSLVSASGKTALQMADENEREQLISKPGEGPAELKKNFKGVIDILRMPQGC